LDDLFHLNLLPILSFSPRVFNDNEVVGRTIELVGGGHEYLYKVLYEVKRNNKRKEHSKQAGPAADGRPGD